MSSSEKGLDIVVEVARDTDAALVAAMARLLPQLDRAASLPSAAQLQAIVDSPSSVLLLARVADSSRSIVGMLALSVVPTPTGMHAWIDDVVVDASVRGQGIGAQLVREALRLAAARGAGSVSLTSRPERVAANRLYRRLGFERRETNVYRYSLARAQTRS